MAENEELTFKQVATSEFRRISCLTGFDIASRDNYVAILGSTNDVSMMELRISTNSSCTFPYNLSYVDVPEGRPLSKLLRNVHLPDIYEKCTVQQSQELALDPVYIADCALELVKSKISHLDWAPMTDTHHIQPVCAILTSPYGACQLFSKTPTSRKWNVKVCDINEIYANIIFPEHTTDTPTNTFAELTALVGRHFITALTWDAAADLRILYTANTIGYIIALQFGSDFTKATEYCQLKTDMGRISYMKSFQHFLLVGNVIGVVQLFRVNHNERLCTVNQVECLWSKADRMSCRRAEITYSKELDSYYVIFTKAAHLLAYRLTNQGNIVCSSTLYVGGIKITDLIALTATDFIISTIIGVVRKIQISSSSHDVLSIEEKIAATDIDVANMQILGIATTCNKAILSFLLFRNKEYKHKAKVNLTTAELSVCKISTTNALQKLVNLNIDVMDKYVDYVSTIKMDILNNLDLDRYLAFNNFIHAKFPTEFNDAFLQQLQLKHIILKFMMAYDETQYNIKSEKLINEFEFLENAIEITNIICRLQYLKETFMNVESLNAFQALAVKSMCAKFSIVVKILNAQITEDNPLKDTITRFVKITSDMLTNKYVNFTKINSNENCKLCGEQINDLTLLCPSEHTAIKRCCISYVQLPLFADRCCMTCNSFALSDDDTLRQLLAPNEIVKCIFCRFLFKNF